MKTEIEDKKLELAELEDKLKELKQMRIALEDMQVEMDRLSEKVGKEDLQ